MTAIQAATSSIRSAPCIALPPNASPARLRASPRRSTLCPHPRVAVLLGGDSAAFSFPPDLAASFGVSLAQVTRDRGGSLLVTPSRRTAPEALSALTAAVVASLTSSGTGPVR